MALVSSYLDGKTLAVNPGVRIDSDNIAEFSREIDAILADNDFSALRIEADDLEYISSAGLRKLLELKQTYADLRVCHVKEDVYSVFEITGFADILRIEKEYREVSVDNCPVIGKGACGTVYKLNDEQIVKVFVDGYPQEKIFLERDNSKKAFTHGINTAIPFDIVRVNGGYGLVYEILRAKSVKSLLEEDRSRLAEYIGIYAAYIRHMHMTTFQKGDFPDLKTEWVKKTEELEGIYSEEEKKAVTDFLMKLPDRLCFVHGDINFGNLMIEDKKPVMIDMEDVKLGHPVYDLAFLYYTLKLLPPLLPADVYTRIMGFPAKDAAQIWDCFADTYFAGRDRGKAEAQIHPYGIVRLLDGVPSCFLAFDTLDDETKARTVDMYQTAAIKRKEELMQLLEGEPAPPEF